MLTHLHRPKWQESWRVESFYLIATIKPRHDKVVEAKEALRTLVAATKAEPGCEVYDLVFGTGGFEGAGSMDAGDWLMIERWASRVAWDAHMESAHVKHLSSIQKISCANQVN